MFGRVICDKLPEQIFENFAIAQVKQGQFEIFKNYKGGLSQKFSKPNIRLLVNHTKPTNILSWI